MLRGTRGSKNEEEVYGGVSVQRECETGMAFVLAIILGGMAFLPGFPVFPAKAAPASGQQTTLTTAHGDTLLGHKLYCIDKGGYAIWGIAEKGDLYEAHRPSQASVPLSSQEQKYVFWAMLSLRAALGDEKGKYIYPGDQCGSKSTGKTGNYQDGVRGRSENNPLCSSCAGKISVAGGSCVK